LVFQQKRALLQRFIDPDEGIKVWDLERVELNFTFDLSFPMEWDEKISPR
jgi:hypothetical protein